VKNTLLPPLGEKKQLGTTRIIQQKLWHDSHTNFNKGFCCWVVNCILPITNFNSGLKYLREVDLDTRDKIAILLEDKTPGLGGCRQIAAKYGMEEHLVRGLANLRQSGNAVLEFLRGSKPDLTVYSFCKTLKEDNMNRCDIVMVLEDHLSIEKESKWCTGQGGVLGTSPKSRWTSRGCPCEFRNFLLSGKHAHSPGTVVIFFYIPCHRKYSQSEYRKSVVYSMVLHPTFSSCAAHMSHWLCWSL